MKIERCKGMRDLCPEDMKKFRFISSVFCESCNKWGYEEIKTPTLESLHLFTSAGTLTPGMLNKVYSFLDWDGWSGERVVLRPEATIPVARLYTESLSDRELAKLFYVANTFIFEETGKKNREKWQLGAELIGIGSPLADVELISLALEVLKKLGIPDIKLKLSHAGLTRGLLRKQGLDIEQQNQMFDRLLDGDTTVLNQIKIEKPELASLLELQGKSSGFVKNLASALLLEMPEFKPQVEDFTFIADSLQSLGYDYYIDMASIRGFEYYTGIIFQLFSADEKIGGGGRYDSLIPAMGGKPTSASGFALYLDTLMQLLLPEMLTSDKIPRILVRMEPGVTKSGFNVADTLRAAGYIVKLDLGGKGPRDITWKLDIRKTIPQLILSDISKHKKFELKTASEVLEILRH